MKCCSVLLYFSYTDWCFWTNSKPAALLCCSSVPRAAPYTLTQVIADVHGPLLRVLHADSAATAPR